jgi:hypothetical protein
VETNVLENKSEISSKDLDVWLSQAHAEPGKMLNAAGGKKNRIQWMFWLFLALRGTDLDVFRQFVLQKCFLILLLGFGTAAHNYFEDLLVPDRVVNVSPEYETVVNNFKDFRHKHEFEVMENELTVYSETHEYAGAVDCIAKMDSKIVVLDWKTSNSL